jgi:initiation factor 1A
MVKNTHGGNSHKKFARKDVVGKKSNRLREATDECEIYSIATKMLGNGMFKAVGIDGVERIVHIRGKFSGKGKRDNFVTLGNWVLVGLHEWATSDTISKKKMPQCDLLEVYSELDKERLKDTVSANWSTLITNDVSHKLMATSTNMVEDGDVIFATEAEIERMEMIERMNFEIINSVSSSQQKNNVSIALGSEDDPDDEEINIDDI